MWRQEAALEQNIVLNKCPLDGSGQLLFRFSEKGVQDVINGKIPKFTNQFVVDPAYYYLYFANCEPEMKITFGARVEMYNVDGSGHKDYLSVGETELSEMYFVSQPVYCFLIFYSGC